MDFWIDLPALAKIFAVGLLAGAGLPALFAVGLRFLTVPAGPSVVREGKPARSSTALAAAVLCFAVVVAAIGYGIYLIVTG
jgi:hypothetical protein